MDIHIVAFVALELQGSLHSARAERSLGAVAPHIVMEILLYFAQAAYFVLILLGVEIAGDPPGSVVRSESKLGELLLNHEIHQVAAGGELVAESQTVVKEAETYVHQPRGPLLLKVHQQLVVVVANRSLLAPYGIPHLVERACVNSGEDEVAVEIIAGADIALAHPSVFIIKLFGFDGASELKTQAAVVQNRSPVGAEAVESHSAGVQLEVHLQGGVGTFQGVLLHNRCFGCAGQGAYKKGRE